MKRKIIYSVIFTVVLLILNITLFFSDFISHFLYLKPNLSMIENGAFEIHFIDVGQGDAVAIKFPNNKTMLVDSGPETGRENLIDYLNRIFFKDNYNTFDYVFLTHSDIDHSGNIQYILDNYNVKCFYRPYIFSKTLEDDKIGYKEENATYDGILTTLANKSITTFFSTDGGVINVGNSKIEIFTYSKIEEVKEANDFSPTLIISSNNTKVCLSGDAGDFVEKDLVKRCVLSEVDLLKLSHHGSKYSNSQEFIDTLSPKFVVCSVGENSYGHPTSDVLLRLAKFDDENNELTYSTLKTTLNDGNIIYYANTNKKLSVVNIESLGDYIFIDWYIVVIVADIFIVINWLIIVIPKKKIKINKHMKNMKA